MILTTIFLITVIAVAITMLITAIIGGLSFAVAFGDVIVFGLVVYLIVRYCQKKKNSKEDETQK